MCINTVGICQGSDASGPAVATVGNAAARAGAGDNNKVVASATVVGNATTGIASSKGRGRGRGAAGNTTGPSSTNSPSPTATDSPSPPKVTSGPACSQA